MKGARERIHTTIYNLSIVLGDKISHSQNLMKLLSGSKHRKGAGSICLCRLEDGKRGREQRHRILAQQRHEDRLLVFPLMSSAWRGGRSYINAAHSAHPTATFLS